MPFVMTTSGGAWPSGGNSVPNCDATQQAAIRAALDVVLNTDFIASVRDKGGELSTLADLLAAKNFDNINFDCGGSNCTEGKFAFSVFRGNTTTFCAGALPPTSQAVTNSTLFHELVHQCGGAELDAWSLEETFFTGRGFSRGNPSAGRYCDSFGTGWPSPAAASGLRVGTFVVWNPMTGEVFTKVISGGGWPSSPMAGPGTRLLGPDNWWRCDADTLGP